MQHLNVSLLLGNISELAFHLEATSKGLVVSKPVSQATVYDCLVDNNKSILKIQIKSTFSEGPSFSVNIGRGSTSKETYTSKEIDYFVIYLAKIKVWYIIPVQELADQIKITFFPYSHQSKWNKFKGCWDFLSR